MIQSRLLFKGKFPPSKVKVSFVQISNRKVDPTIEQKLPKLWSQLKKKSAAGGEILTDWVNFRLESFSQEVDHLRLVLSKYNFSVRYPLNSLVDELNKLGFDYLSRGLSVGGFVKTKDGFYLFGKRNNRVSNVNRVDFLGGFLANIDITSSMDILNHNIQEMHEEANILPGDIQQINIIGGVLTPVSNIVLVTSTVLNITLKEVIKKFAQRKDDEMSDLIIKKQTELHRFLIELGGYKPVLIDIINLID